jgi:hypothetical protein
MFLLYIYTIGNKNMKMNIAKLLMVMGCVSMLSSNVYATGTLATTKPTLTVTGTIAAIATLALGTATATSGQTQTLTFPLAVGATEVKNMDGAQGGASSGLVVSDNDNNGWTIKVDSTNGGKMKGASTAQLIPFTISVDGSAVASIPLTSATTPATVTLSTGSAGLAPANGEVHILSATHPTITATQPADVYTDLVTFYLYSN